MRLTIRRGLFQVVRHAAHGFQGREMKLISFCKALSDVTRVRLVNILARYELNVGEIVQALDMGQSRISRHLKILADSGLLECRRDGLWAFYKAAESGPGKMFLDAASDLLAEDETLADDLDRARQVVRDRAVVSRQFFDSIASEWQRLRQDVLGDFDLAGKVRESLPESCPVLADLGCGLGDMIDALRGKADKIIGVDNSPRMLDLAGQRLAGVKGLSLRIGELSHLPLKDGEADCAVMSMVLHHMSQPVDALLESSRAMKSGGELIIVDFDKHENESMRKEYGDHRLGFDRPKLEGWLTEAGFKVAGQELFPVRKGLTVFVLKAKKK